MRNKLLLILSLMLIVPLSVRADVKPKVLTLDAELSNNTISYSGTTEDDAYAVMCKLLDDNDEEIDKLSVSVDNNAFEGTFITLETGDYKVACANYEGGEIKTVSVTVETVATFTVAFNTNGGSEISSVEIEYGDTVEQPNNPTKGELVFGGWYEDSTLTTPFDFTKIITANISLYAKWSVAIDEMQVVFKGEGGTYQVDFDTDDYDNQGALGAPVTSTNRYFVPHGNEVTLTAVADDTHEFIGWFNCEEVDISNGHGVMDWVAVGEVLSSNSSYTFAVSNSYYNVMPVFESKAGHNNIWATNGGKVAVLYEDSENPDHDGEHYGIGHVVDYVKGDMITVKAEADEGYHFIGWFVSDVERGAEYYLRDSIVSTNANYTYQPGVTTVAGIDEAINYLTAAFEEDELGMFTVSFNTNGGSNISPVEVEAGQTVGRPEDPVNGNKIFIQWCEDETLTTEFDFNTPIDADITLYAKWQTPTFILTFDTNGGSEISPLEVEDGERAVEPDNPTKDGLIFAGWFEDEELEIEFSFSNPIVSDTTIYAKWDKVYNLEDDSDNEVTFVDEPNQDLSLVVTDLSNLTDEELEEMSLSRDEYKAIVDSLTESSLKYGMLLSFLDITVFDNNNEPIDVGEVRVKLKIKDDLKGYKAYKLVYIDTDDDGNIILSEAYTFTLEGDYLVGTLPHLSPYVLVGDNTEDVTTNVEDNVTSSPKTGDNIVIWIIALSVSGIGILIGIISSFKMKRVK